MGDSDGSSNAAQSARSKEGIFSGLARVFARPNKHNSGVAVSDTTSNTSVSRNGGVRSLANLTRLRVEDVMVPKVEITAAALDTGEKELVEIFRESGLTRVPIYKDTMDTPMGLVHLKDFALRHGFNSGAGEFDLDAMLRPLLYAPPSMPIGVLLQKMQTDRIHMALVIDEYGGVDGLVTIEDLIEPVIGEIEDEHDIDEDQAWIVEAPGCYLAQSRTDIEDFEAEIDQKLQLDDEEEDIDTLGGLVFQLAGRVPARGEVVKHPHGLDFEVVDADPRRIKRLRVRLNPARQQAAE